MRPVNRDIEGHAILRRGKFPGLRYPESVSGTCARKEGLRTLTSPRREASLFKLGRNFGSGHFLVFRTVPTAFLLVEIFAPVRRPAMRANPKGSRLNSKSRCARSDGAMCRPGPRCFA